MARWTSGAALQYVMGKQYPGEQLPRWAFHCLWRADGEPVWRDPALFGAPEHETGTATSIRRATDFAGRLAERLQIDPSLVIPAYEDVHYYLWREHRLPANVLAEDAKLLDPLERARLARVFGRGRAQAWVGSKLPLRRVLDDGAAAAGSPASGSSAPAKCSWSPATHPSAFASRWKVSHGQTPKRSRRRSSRIPSRRAIRCRRARPSRSAA